jgi:hypothetical protein
MKREGCENSLRDPVHVFTGVADGGALSPATCISSADAVRVVAEGIGLRLEDDQLGQFVVRPEEGDIARRAGAAAQSNVWRKRVEF